MEQFSTSKNRTTWTSKNRTTLFKALIYIMYNFNFSNKCTSMVHVMLDFSSCGLSFKYLGIHSFSWHCLWLDYLPTQSISYAQNISFIDII